MILAERIRNLSSQQQKLLLERLGHVKAPADSEKQIAAYIVCRPGQSVSAEALKNTLASHLPDFMVPAHFVFLDALPLNPNGKVDRNALPAPQVEPLPSQTCSLKPRNDIESKLVSIWAEVLRLQTFGVDDNFFQLGGHSLLALQVMARLRDAFKVDLPLKTLFANPTVAGLAEAVSKAATQPSARKISRRSSSPAASTINPGLGHGRSSQEF